MCVAFMRACVCTRQVGSGVFIDCDAMRARGGRIIAHRGRSSAGACLGARCPDDRMMGQWMHDNDVAMMIFTEESFECA